MPRAIEYRLIDFASRGALRAPLQNETTLVIDAFGFPPEGEKSDASLLMDAYMKGWRRFISFGCIGQRYIGNGLGPETDDVTIDVYDSSGDYLASGIDGMTIAVHGNAQDQLGQIIKRGKLVIYGDVGQTFLYGAKGGEIYVMGNAAGRPLINSVGKTPGGHQRHLPRLSGRILHGGRSPQRRRLRHPERRAIRRRRRASS